jgi:hypothetical protein
MTAVVADRFELLAPIGSGGVAEVHRARDRRSGAPVALKRLLPQLTADRAVSRRFLREAEAARALEHPGIVRVLEAGEADGRPYLVMELVEGEDLRRRLDREGRFPWAEARRIARALAEALAHAHARGVVHRDVKPHNVLLAGDTVKLADFGLARVETLASLTGSSLVWGSPEYMAPELFGRGRADPRSDLFSLGVVLFEMATGRLPWKDRSLARLMTAVTDPPPALPSLGQGEAIDRLLRALLAPTPALRPATAAEVIAALDGAGEEAALVTEVPCSHCGALRPEDIPRCFACGHAEVAVEHTPGGGWTVRLKRIDDDATSMSVFHRAMAGLTGRPDLRAKFLIGSVHLYSRAEKKEAIPLPAVLFEDLDEPAAQEIARSLVRQGLEASAAPASISRRLQLFKGAATTATVAGFGSIVAVHSLHMAALPYMLAMGLVAGIAVGQREIPRAAGRFRLAARRPAGPAAARLLDTAATHAGALEAPEVRALFVDVTGELYRLSRRAEELAQASPQGSTEEDLARRLLLAAPPLGRRLEDIARRLQALDTALAGDREADNLRALAAIERALPSASPERRQELEQTRRELEAASEHRRTAESERERLASTLCRMLGQVRELYRRAARLRTAEEHEAAAITAALAELDACL